MGVNKNGPLSTLFATTLYGRKCDDEFFSLNCTQYGRSVKLAGGMTVPFSRTNGTGAPSHCALKFCEIFKEV